MSAGIGNAAISANEPPIDIEKTITICVGDMIGDFQFKSRTQRISERDIENVTQYVAAVLSRQANATITPSMFSLRPLGTTILQKKWTWDQLDKEYGFFLAILHPLESDALAPQMSSVVISEEASKESEFGKPLPSSTDVNRSPLSCSGKVTALESTEVDAQDDIASPNAFEDLLSRFAETETRLNRESVKQNVAVAKL